MRTLLRILGWTLGALVLAVLLLLSPVAYHEVACRGEALESGRQPILPPEHRRPAARTLMTYPEWHIVYAYEDYAATIRAGDPHDFGFLSAITQFWQGACAMNRASAQFGGAAWTARQTIHVIGVSFTAEMLLKALYEETLGRAATWVRGETRAPLDDLSADQATAYAAFLHQTPWYRWDFSADRAALSAADTGSVRDRERDLALGLEYGAKALYAQAIGAAVAATGQDELTMRSVVAGLSPDDLAAIEGVTVIAERPEGVEVETPRYEAFNGVARAIAGAGGSFVEVAGNDRILVTAVSSSDEPLPDDLMALPRQGEGGTRHLLLIPVSDFAARLTDPALPIDHVFDY